MELDDPTPAPDEVLVRVARCGLNRADVNFSWGEYGGLKYSDLHPKGKDGRAPTGPDFPLAMGIEPTGTVVGLGDNVDHSWLERRVVIVPRFGCGHCAACRLGNDHLCLHMKTLGTSTPNKGGLDELVCVPATHVLDLPDALSFDVGAAIAADLAPTWWIVHDLAALDTGMTVAVKGASGNVGRATLAISKLIGARSVALTRNAEKSQQLLDAGADVVLEADPTNAAEAIKEATDGGADVVVEPFGGESWSDSLKSVRNGGSIAMVGTFVGVRAMTDLGDIFHHSVRVVGGAHSPKAVVQRMIGLLAQGHLMPEIGAVVPLSQISDALELQESSALVGKVVVDLTSP